MVPCLICLLLRRRPTPVVGMARKKLRVPALQAPLWLERPGAPTPLAAVGRPLLLLLRRGLCSSLSLQVSSFTATHASE